MPKDNTKQSKLPIKVKLCRQEKPIKETTAKQRANAIAANVFSEQITNAFKSTNKYGRREKKVTK